MEVKLIVKATNESTIRFNVVDALIIIFILALSVLSVYIFILGNDFADLYSQEENVSYTVRLSCVDESIKNKISVGDIAYQNRKTTNTGTVTDVQVIEWEDKTGYDLYVTITADVRKINAIYYINGAKIEKGALINVSFSKLDVSNAVECSEFKIN